MTMLERLQQPLAYGALSALLALVGPVTPSAGTSGGPVPADGLAPSGSCDSLLRWYVDHSLSQVTAYGWAGGVMYPLAAAKAQSFASGSSSSAGVADGAVSNGPTGTNTQEAGVDEPDIAKTDGHVVVRLVEGRRVVITDVSGSSPRDVGSWTLPSGSFGQDLLLVGGHAVVSASAQGMVEPMVDSGVAYDRGTVGGTRTDLYDLDLSTPSAPTMVQHVSWSGRRLALRQYGDTVRLVTDTGLPQFRFVQPGKGMSEDQSLRHNEALVRESRIEDWLPTRAEDGHEHRAVDCASIYHPTNGPSTGTITVVTLNPGSLEHDPGVAVTGAGSDVYSSADRLYVWQQGFPQAILERTPARLVRPTIGQRTTIHAFALDGGTARYVASGTIAGTVRDRWSFDEQDGHLRVAVSYPPSPHLRPDRFVTPVGQPQDNGIDVLDEQGGRLVQVGQVRGLGENESVESVRWLGDLAIVVTFRQMDPLYTVDLSDARHPRELGALHLPGFSTYLHPIGNGQLLGLGMEVTSSGEGGKVGVFDISDPTKASETDHVSFGSDTWLPAAQDPHQLSFVPDGSGGTAITTLSGAGYGDGTPLVIRVVDGKLTTWHLPSPGGYQQRALPLPDGRVALTGTHVVVTPLRAVGS